MKRTIYINNQRIRLDASQLIQTGGEGMVFDMGDTAVKLYHIPTKQHQNKLTHLLNLQLPTGVLGPCHMVHNSKKQFIGFQMPKLPGGSLLVIGTSFREITYPDLGPRLVAGDLLIEFRMPEAQGGAPELLWTWDAFEHLDPQRVRDGFNEPIAEPGTGALAHDWTHVNAVVHDPRDDSLLVSVRHQDWILKLDRETGDIAWRLGIEGDFTLEEGAWFFHQHSPQWQPDGALLVYDNGNNRPGTVTRTSCSTPPDRLNSTLDCGSRSPAAMPRTTNRI